jgi:hypothetical protein
LFPIPLSIFCKFVKAGKNNKRNVKEWLCGQDMYTLHKPVRKRFRKNRYTVTNIDDAWEMDLADLSSLSKYDDKYKYLLNVIDIVPRYAWSVTLKDKTTTSITAGLKALFQIENQLRQNRTSAPNLLMQLSTILEASRRKFSYNSQPRH